MAAGGTELTKGARGAKHAKYTKDTKDTNDNKHGKAAKRKLPAKTATNSTRPKKKFEEKINIMFKPIDELIDFLQTAEILMYRPGELEYERTVVNPNLLYRYSRPQVVVQPENATEVQYIVYQAKQLKIPMTIKNGGHSYSGSSATDAGVLLDLLNLNEVHLDMGSKTMTIGGDTIRSVVSVTEQEPRSFKHQFQGERVLASFTFIHSGGVGSRREDSDTAFRWRKSVYHAYLQITWEDKFMERDMRGYLQTFKNRIRPFAMAGCAAYVNFPDSSLKPGDHETAYYGKNRDKLRYIKELYDPHDYSSWAHGIQLPATDENVKVDYNYYRMQLDEANRAAEEQDESDNLSSDTESVNEETLTDAMAARHWKTGSRKLGEDWPGKCAVDFPFPSAAQDVFW
ncbi:hypothetical protein BKA67DRAFT_674299 [Truncatella angustata]|uniref:FAD-binding PCMH-type domain-containing protein n=1 Tax=Truncatella angustata TaxID=152316 RepID=A0A9P9A1H3_9PEZI|nr:uncharacterized protein BKA67DRAFT_674299 [Truncatella angustata]KAH6658338.1 hypothetical protein BKA67DRAFT_674299 [Truncatella angustata]